MRVMCPSPWCTVGVDPYLLVYACDAEGDALVADVEVVPRGQPFSRKPTFSGSWPAVYPAPPGGNCAAVRVPMPGLTPEQSYDFAVRVSDEFGAVFERWYSSDGWFQLRSWQ